MTRKVTPPNNIHIIWQLGCVLTNYVHPNIWTVLQINARETSGFTVQVKIFTNSWQSILTLARCDNFLLSVKVVFVALGVAAAALEGRRGLEDVPQWPSADLAARGEVIESEDELVAFVADIGGAIAIRCGLHYNLLFTFALAFISIQDLDKKEWESSRIRELYRLREGEGAERKEYKKGSSSLPGISLEFLWHLHGTHQFEWQVGRETAYCRRQRWKS